MATINDFGNKTPEEHFKSLSISKLTYELKLGQYSGAYKRIGEAELAGKIERQRQAQLSQSKIFQKITLIAAVISAVVGIYNALHPH